MNRKDLNAMSQFHAAWVRYWEREFNVERDCSREAYVRALEAVKANCVIWDKSTSEYFIKECEFGLGLNEDFLNMKWVED